ncbi:hypothetical protein P7K49_018869 [Saguinus oedipus]|uniref:WH1 domain-containing protein n=1 Tax=Saguinus oedipus TaxID=9490 RepID=A0ABQ9V6M0_SAGOE|nr:hypothetical protein P7K49_018869 [Saguinus oedipus]
MPQPVLLGETHKEDVSVTQTQSSLERGPGPPRALGLHEDRAQAGEWVSCHPHISPLDTLHYGYVSCRFLKTEQVPCPRSRPRPPKVTSDLEFQHILGSQVDSSGHPRSPTEWRGAGADPSASRHIFQAGSRCRRGGERAGDAWSDQLRRQNSPFSPEPMSSRSTPTSGRTGSCERAAVTVSSFYEVTRNAHGIVSVGRAKATVTSTIAPNTTFPKMPQKADGRARTVFGLGFSSERQLTTFAEKFQELKEAAEMPKDKAREKTETWSHAPSSAAASSVKGGDEKTSQPLQPTRTGSLRRTHRDRRDAERGHRAGAEAAAAAPEESHAPRTTALQEAAASAEPGKGQEEEKKTQPKRRMEELEADLRGQETELKGLRKQSEIPPQLLSERLCR